MTTADIASRSSAAQPSRARPLAIARWLLIVAALILAMVVVGGITRLTESGLSITEWKPISGAIPPLGASEWQHAFDLYKATPEYREINAAAGMTLGDFKFIYFWEWVHRLLGRVIGLAFALPLAWFALRRAIPRGYALRLTVLLLLGGMQGVVGWWMVTSGLVNRTDVSHFRLAAHLLLALAILAAVVWTALDLRRLGADPAARSARLTGWGAAALGALFVQLLLGAWVAGLNAGQVASDWPTMQGRLIPDGIDASRGALFALTHDPYLIHFLHRWWAWGVVVILVLFARRVKPESRRAATAIHSAFGTQVLLGIVTVLSGVALWIAVLHQAVGAMLVAAVAWGAQVHGARR